MTPEIPCILLIEDDIDYSSMLLRRLKQENFAILSASTGRAGLRLAESRRPDLILLDIGLPDTDGVQLFEIFRLNPKTSAIPIILITGLGMPAGVIDAVAYGLKTETAFCKSDGLDALIKRIYRIIRPAEQGLAMNPRQLLRKGPLALDLKTRQFIFKGETFPPLAPRRFDLLCALIRHNGPVSREELLKEIWGDWRDPKVVDMTVARLRRDLENLNQNIIKTTRHGYTLVFSPNFS